jgi:hypothetical protein
MVTHFLVSSLISVDAEICSICEFAVFVIVQHSAGFIELIHYFFLYCSHFENNWLTGELPSSLGDLPNLKEL